MLSYQIKSLSVLITNKQFEDEKARVMLELMGNQPNPNMNDPRILSQNVDEIAKDRILQRVCDECLNTLRMETNGSAFFMPPHTKFLGATNEGLRFAIFIVFYPFFVLQRIQLAGLPIPFQYMPIDQATLEANFQKFIASYPIIREVEGPIRDEDLVVISSKISRNGALLQENNEIIIEAQNTPNFSLNRIILGRMINETFITEAPDGNLIETTIHSIKRPEPTYLTDENVKEIKLEGINTLNDLRAKVAFDTRREHAAAELLGYFQKALQFLVRALQIVIPNDYVEAEVSNLLLIEHMNLMKTPGNRVNLMQEVTQNTSLGVSTRRRLREKAEAMFVNQLLENVIIMQSGINVMPDEIQREMFFLRNSGAIPEKDITEETVRSIIMNQKMALFLLKINNPYAYNLISQDLQRFV